ncbi:MAG: cell division protein FtsQ/DivIB [Chloroflexota bacterium]
MSAKRRTEQDRRGTATGRRRAGRRARFKSYTLQLLRTGRLPAFLMSVGLSVILGAFAISDDFAIETVVIRGNSIAYADSIVETSDAIGESVFRIVPSQVADRVAAHPVVESAEVRTELPDRMIIEVVEREPAIVWQTGDQAVLVDAYGWVLGEGDDPALPRVVELDGEMPEPGTRVGTERVEAVRYLLNEFGEAATLEHSDENGFSIHLDDDRVVVFGDAEELPVKVEVVSRIRGMDVEWTRLDVRDPERPFYHE